MTPAEFRRIRVAVLGLSQSQLSKRIHFTTYSISKMENSRAPITAQTAELMRMLKKEKLAQVSAP